MKDYYRGPQGVYDVQGTVAGFATSDPIKVMITSPAYAVQLMNSLDQLQNSYIGPVGQPLPLQPTVRVVDSDGNPISGKH